MIFNLKRDMLDSQLYPWNIKVIARKYRVMRKLLKTRGAHNRRISDLLRRSYNIIYSINFKLMTNP